MLIARSATRPDNESKVRYYPCWRPALHRTDTDTFCALPPQAPRHRFRTRESPTCKQAKRQAHGHFLRHCPYLRPSKDTIMNYRILGPSDEQFMAEAKVLAEDDLEEGIADSELEYEDAERHETTSPVQSVQTQTLITLPCERGEGMEAIGLNDVNTGHEVRLHTTEIAWKPKHKDAPEVGEDEGRTAFVYKAVHSILNKLTPETFDTLTQQMLHLDVDNEERLTGVMNIVFEKAISEPNSASIYAKMCKCMINVKVPQTEQPEQMVAFRKLLLDKCQKEFEKDKEDAEDQAKRQHKMDEVSSEDEKKQLVLRQDEAEAKGHRRSLGNIRFIGELFKQKMLTQAIMHDCILKMLRCHDEESTECMCQLMLTVGKELDHERASCRMNQYFCQMDTIIRAKKTSARIRFMLQDVLELRQNKWVQRRACNIPKTSSRSTARPRRKHRRRSCCPKRRTVIPAR